MAVRNEVTLSGWANSDAFQRKPRAPWTLVLTQGYPKQYYSVICWPEKCNGPAHQVKYGDFVEVRGRLHQRNSVGESGRNLNRIEIIAVSLTIRPKDPKPLTPSYFEGKRDE